MAFLGRHGWHAGFGVPVSEWTRGALRDWAEDLLDERRLRTQGFLKPAAVRRVWRQHLCGWRDHENLLWILLVCQAWHDAWAGDRQKSVPLRAAS